MQVLPIPRRVLGSPLIGALTTPNPVDRYLGLVNPTWSAREVRATVQSVARQTDRSVTITLKPNSNWKGFRSGQHVGLTVQIDGIQRTRFYSIANSETLRGRLELTVSAHPEGLVSNWLLENARPGLVVHLTQSQGEFVLSKALPESVLLISGGSGITPAISILRTLCATDYDGEIVFLNYAREADLALYENELTALAAANENVSVFRALTRESGGDFKGHFSRRHLRAVMPDVGQAQTFACGPTALIESVKKIWSAGGLEDQLLVEHFVPPKAAVVSSDATGQLIFAASGIRAANNGTTLLDQAEAAGLTPKAGCRMGMCHTCVCKMQSGQIRHVQTGETRTIENELVQICVNAPVGEVEIDL
jgi:ferredoxin-NADP reductase